MAVTMKLTGDRELAAAFSRLGAAVQGQKLIGALEAGALPILNDWKRRTPVVTGTHRRSEHVGDQQASGTDASVKVGTDIEYGPRLELGFVGTDALGRTYHQPAGGYLRAALESQKGAAQAEVAAALRDLIMAAV